MSFERHIPALVIVCCLASAGWAQVDDSINNPHSPSGMVRPDALVYEGLLVYLESPVSGEVDMVVTAWDRPMGGEPLDGPTLYEGVRVEEGWFRVELEPTLLERGRGFAWLEVAVRWPAGPGEFEMLDGRQRLDFASVSFVPRGDVETDVMDDAADEERAGATPRVRSGVPAAAGRRVAGGDVPTARGGSPFARPAGGIKIDGDDGSGGGGDSRACDWVISGSNVYYTCGNVGVGTTSPIYPLHVVGSGQYAVYGESTLSTSDFAYGVWGQAASTTGRGVLGFATAGTGSTVGVYGRSDSTTGRGVYGLAESASGVNYGVYGETKSADGYAGYFKGGGQLLRGPRRHRR
ncbi:MAG: hypothetical protein KJZ54_05835 [Phycisphaerales bacterium]|nr:hypothetical protein [Phycisphaerales bacterium]